MNELALFAGAGGGILGGQLLGWRTVCAVEFDPYAASVLLARQNDGFLSPFPIWDDVRTFDGRPWRGIVDVVSGGFPCQDISAAGRGEGLEGERSGLWMEMARIIGEVRPRFVFVENSPLLTSRGLGRVLGDLAEMGFDARWGVLGAAHVGAPHKRERIWIMAHSELRGIQERRRIKDACKKADGQERIRSDESQSLPKQKGNILADTLRERLQIVNEAGDRQSPAAGKRKGRKSERVYAKGGWEQWRAEPNVGRVVDGVAARVDRIRCLGNGQVPQCAAEAWRLLTEGLEQ